MYNVLVERRAIDVEYNHDLMGHNGQVLTRPSTSGASTISYAAMALELLGLVERLKPGVYAITPYGRAEAELWYPELRPKKAE